ncbi:pectin acetylesterase 5-like [Impatiens glandulifera]|uniref:pectin acetylesterase 5-like n=1 Tax=Impatiens glandulifera TaxID=253017 RepID=UPI001FB0C28F|nr:pectin acetylesterase 5-like [Impatiens glandulifera]
MISQRLRRLILSQKWTKKEWTVAAAVSLVVLMYAFSFLSESQSKDRSNGAQPFGSSSAVSVPLTLLRNSKEKGAFCLDGSSPGYHIQKGFGSGLESWVLHIEGGGWCGTIEGCSSRRGTQLGSSNSMDLQVQFSGILSSLPSQNPDFFNWNKVKIRYCDGGSLSGHPEAEFTNGTTLLFRGQLIWEAIMDELLSLGLSNAKQALLSGCSAGGLATFLHCDDFREILPKDITVKCLADASFFLNEKDIAGQNTMASLYQSVVNLQGSEKSLDKECLTRTESSKHYQCLFPQEFLMNIKTPLFLVHPAYDFWQIQHIFVPDNSDPRGEWFRCKRNILQCNSEQLEVLHGYRNSLLKILDDVQQKKKFGMFVNSCFVHCQTWMTETWHSPNSPRINNKTIAESVGDWYFGRKDVKHIDCPFPCNPTCRNMDMLHSILH